MPRRKVAFCPGEYYHIYNRGNNRQDIFFERENYLFFLRKLGIYVLGIENSTPAAQSSRGAGAQAAEIIAYCLMPNHYHLLVLLHDEAFSKRMQSFGQSYTNAINKRFSRVGSLFQGPFQAVHVDREDYLLHLSRYIHLNPVTAGLVRTAEDWEFSSYRDYLGIRKGRLPNLKVVLAQFSSAEKYRRFVESGVPNDESIIQHLKID